MSEISSKKKGEIYPFVRTRHRLECIRANHTHRKIPRQKEIPRKENIFEAFYRS